MQTVKKIVLIGPESTGKTTLANQLSRHYQTNLVEEYARTYIDSLDGLYEKDDLLKIAKGQISNEDKASLTANQVLICDTDLIVIKVWSEVKYGNCDDWILKQIKERHYDLYLLCGIDIPWEYDEQREHPHFRKELYEKYVIQLQQYNKKYIELVGNKEVRFMKSIENIDKYIIEK